MAISNHIGIIVFSHKNGYSFLRSFNDEENYYCNKQLTEYILYSNDHLFYFQTEAFPKPHVTKIVPLQELKDEYFNGGSFDPHFVKCISDVVHDIGNGPTYVYKNNDYKTIIHEYHILDEFAFIVDESYAESIFLKPIKYHYRFNPDIMSDWDKPEPIESWDGYYNERINIADFLWWFPFHFSNQIPYETFDSEMWKTIKRRLTNEFTLQHRGQRTNWLAEAIAHEPIRFYEGKTPPLGVVNEENLYSILGDNKWFYLPTKSSMITKSISIMKKNVKYNTYPYDDKITEILNSHSAFLSRYSVFMTNKNVHTYRALLKQLLDFITKFTNHACLCSVVKVY